MTIEAHFSRAKAAETWGGRVFKAVLFVSLVALLFPDENVQNTVNPVLIAACVAGVVLSLLTLTWQNAGNQALRATQLANAFNVPIGDAARRDYYNNLFPPSVDRLAATTFENTLFTSKVLDAMLTKERLVAAAYVSVFILMMAFRWSTTNALLLLAQTVFSVDVVLHWLRMERFQNRVCRVKQELRQFFVQGGTAGDVRGLAIALAAFSDYECAKDEAAMPLDDKIFEKLNPKVSKEWDELRAALKIP